MNLLKTLKKYRMKAPKIKHFSRYCPNKFIFNISDQNICKTHSLQSSLPNNTACPM